MSGVSAEHPKSCPFRAGFTRAGRASVARNRDDGGIYVMDGSTSYQAKE
ncbi:hypothetical protein [Aromatoleum sp.]